MFEEVFESIKSCGSINAVVLITHRLTMSMTRC
jgi:hypothetical protein